MNETKYVPMTISETNENASSVTESTNVTRNCGEMSEGFLIFVVSYYVFVIIVGLIGNSLIIAAFLIGSKLRRVTVNVIMVHMAIVNLIYVCISNPITLIKNFHPKLIENKYINLTLCLTFWLCFNISLYNLVAISINRYLLIARPQTTFRRFCIGRAIALTLVLIWLFALLLHLSLGLQLTLSSDLYKNRQTELNGTDHLHKITPMELVMIYSLAIFVPPLIIIPVMHSLTLYTMRSSTRRVMKASDDPAINRQLRAARGQSSTPSNSAQPGLPLNASSGSLLNCSKSDQSMDAVTTKHLASQSLRAVAIVIAPQASAASLEMEQRSRELQRSSRGLGIRILSICFPCVASADDADVQGPHRPRLGRQRGELRLIRLMLSVYLILIATWVPTLVMMTDIFDIKELHIHGLLKLGLLYPLFPSLVPYVYLWSNRNFQRALRRSFRKRSLSQRYKPPVEQK